MDLTVNGKIIATLQDQPVYLSPILGAFELVFPFAVKVDAKTEGVYRWLAVSGARITLMAIGGQFSEIGFARPDKAAVIRQLDNSGHVDFALKILLQPYQLEMLEVARNGGGLNFALKFFARAGSSSDSQYDWEEHTNLHIDVPQSSWIAQLNASKADRILLFEVRLPAMHSESLQHPASRHLVRAQQLFTQGDWRECISQCRQFAEELGGDRLTPALDRLSKERKPMTKEEREAVVLAALQHYGHPSVHSESKHGELDYDRSDAKLALSVAASLATFHFRRE